MKAIVRGAISTVSLGKWIMLTLRQQLSKACYFRSHSLLERRHILPSIRQFRSASENYGAIGSFICLQYTAHLRLLRWRTWGKLCNFCSLQWASKISYIKQYNHTLHNQYAPSSFLWWLSGPIRRQTGSDGRQGWLGFVPLLLNHTCPWSLLLEHQDRTRRECFTKATCNLSIWACRHYTHWWGKWLWNPTLP